MARRPPNKKQLAMAENFCFGATKGDWELSALAAGYVNVPDEDNETIWDCIRGHQDAGAGLDGDDLKALAKRGREFLLSLVESGGRGAQQAAVALTRLEKVEAKIEEPGVVILPTIGERENMWLCPKCYEEYDTEVWPLYTAIIHERINESDKWDQLKVILSGD